MLNDTKHTAHCRKAVSCAQVLKAIANKRAPLFVEHIQHAALSPSDNSTAGRGNSALIAVEMTPRSLLRLDLSSGVTLKQWLRITLLLHRMPLEHLAVVLPLASARRERSIKFELRTREVWTSGPAGANPPLCADDIDSLAEAAVTGGLRRLRSFDLLHSQLDAPCMAALGRLLAGVSPTLISLNLHCSLRLYKLTENGCCDVLVCDALRTLKRLQVLCVTGLMMPGMQMAGGPDGLQLLVPWGDLPELQVVVFSPPAAVGHARNADGRPLGMRLGESPAKFQTRLLNSFE